MSYVERIFDTLFQLLDTILRRGVSGKSRMSTLLCGDGAADFFNDYRSTLSTLAPPQSRLQNATGVCLAEASASLIDPELLEVSYLQKVKAEKDLEYRSKTN